MSFDPTGTAGRGDGGTRGRKENLTPMKYALHFIGQAGFTPLNSPEALGIQRDRHDYGGYFFHGFQKKPRNRQSACGGEKGVRRRTEGSRLKGGRPKG